MGIDYKKHKFIKSKSFKNHKDGTHHPWKTPMRYALLLGNQWIKGN